MDFDTETFVVPALATGDLARQSSKGVDSDATTTLVPTLAGPLGGPSGAGGFRQDLDNHGAYIPVAFDERVITSPGNRSAVRPGDPAPTLNGGGQVAVAFHLTQDPIHGEDVTPAMGTGNAAGCATVGVAVAFTERTRAGGRNVEAQDELAYSLNNPGAGGRTQENRVVTPTLAVRRLTPTECERLMGLPDGWTEGHTDSARYRMLGNSIAIPVLAWIARRMVEQGR